MLGLLVYKIPYSINSCIFNSAVSCSCLRCHIYSWFLSMLWILDLSILLFSLSVYVCSAGYAELPILLYLLQCLVYHML